MIYWLLIYEFIKIGLFAIGGGLATIPFVLDLADKYQWFNIQEFADMVAIVQSMPGPFGVGLAAFVGFTAAGVFGTFAAALSLVLPAIAVVMLVEIVLKKYACNRNFVAMLGGIRPAVVALILYATYQLAKISIVDIKSALVAAAIFVLMLFYKKSPIFYIFLSAAVGIFLKL